MRWYPTGGLGRRTTFSRPVFDDACGQGAGPSCPGSAIANLVFAGYFDTVRNEAVALDSIWRPLGTVTWQVDEANRVLLLADNEGQDTSHRGMISATTLPSASRRQDSPNCTYNATWEYVISANNFLAVKITGFDGKDDRLPYNGDRPGRYDVASGPSWDNASFTQREHDRRQTLDAS